MNSAAERTPRLILARIRELLTVRGEPLLVAIDGHSGAGKSTLARDLGAELVATVIDCDDFYAGGSAADWDARSAAQNAGKCIDWRLLRQEALEPLLAGRPASWYPFDWEAGRGLAQRATTAQPASIVILEGAYSARPELSDLIDLSIFVYVPAGIRRACLVGRDGAGAVDDWYRRWDEAERYYFTQLRPPSSFDIVVANNAPPDHQV